MSKKLDLSEKVFGRLTVIAPAESRSGRSYWTVKCDCGTQKEVMGKHLVSGATVSCGCFSAETTSRVRRLNLVGKVFGRLTVKEDLGTKGRSLWRCQCSCGGAVNVTADRLSSGNTKSCGCLQREAAAKSSTTHGLHNTSAYTSWSNMKARCTNSNLISYRYYGGRGIKMDPRWKYFSNFIEDMGDKPEGYTLERLDVNGDYCKANCVWAPWDTQATNRRTNVTVNVLDKSLPLEQACFYLGVDYMLAVSKFYRKKKNNPNVSYEEVLHGMFRKTRK